MRWTSVLGRKLEQVITQMVCEFQGQEAVVIPLSQGLQRVNWGQTSFFFFFCKSHQNYRWGLTDVVYLHFSKSFHSVSHSTFEEKMDRCGLDV